MQVRVQKSACMSFEHGGHMSRYWHLNHQPTLSLNLPANITLDASTAHQRLIISPDGKQVHCGERNQPVPNNPERFDRVVCVLAKQGFNSGRHYWEVGGTRVKLLTVVGHHRTHVRRLHQPKAQFRCGRDVP